MSAYLRRISSDPDELNELQSCILSAHLLFTSCCTFCFNAWTRWRSFSITCEPKKKNNERRQSINNRIRFLYSKITKSIIPCWQRCKCLFRSISFKDSIVFLPRDRLSSSMFMGASKVTLLIRSISSRLGYFLSVTKKA